YAVIGFSLTPMSDEKFRDVMRAALRERAGAGAGLADDDPLIQALHYQPGDAGDPGSFASLKAKVEAVERERQLPGNRLFYLSVAPGFFAKIVTQLAAAGSPPPPSAPIWRPPAPRQPFRAHPAAPPPAP